jgi:hypothetical protein
MACKSIIMLLLLFISIIFLWDPISFEASALSPSFPMQELTDFHNLTSRTTNTTGTSFPDIQIVDYVSDGKFLNATLWLSPSITVSNFATGITYGMLIDADSNNATGYHGIDYILSMRLQGNMWNMRIFQISRLGTILPVQTVPNDTDPLLGFTNLIHLSLDLSKINYPSNYRVMFYAVKEQLIGKTGTFTAVHDFTNLVDIPRPNFSLTTSNPVELRPGDSTSIQVLLGSSTGDNLEVSNFNVNHDIRSGGIYVSPTNAGASSFNIRVPSHTVPGLYSIPIVANIVRNSTPPFDPILFQAYPGVSDVKGVIISKPLFLNIKVLSPLTFSQQFKDFWETFGSFISVLIGGFTAGSAALVFDRLRQRQKTKRDQRRGRRHESVHHEQHHRGSPL